MDKIVSEFSKWENSNTQVFWGEIAPCEHLVQIYENDKIFLDTLEGYVSNGLLAGDSVVLVATSGHLEALNERLRSQHFNLNTLIETDQYIALDAKETLSKFMINDWPDEKLFEQLITKILSRAKQNNRKVRAFGEMVALLWEQGHNGATVKLENLWNQLHKNKDFSLFCAYPKTGFTQCANDSIDSICKTHSTVIDGQSRSAAEIYYRTVK